MADRKQKAAGQHQAAVPVITFTDAAKAAGLCPVTGKNAVENRYKSLITAQRTSTKFTGSVDLDHAFVDKELHANRWDYGLGIQREGQSEHVIWVEPHSGASTGEVKTMLAKLDWLEAKLRHPDFVQLKQLTDMARYQRIRPYIWLSSGTVKLRAGSKEAHMLAIRGMDLPCSHLRV